MSYAHRINPMYDHSSCMIFVLSCMINVDHGLYHDPYFYLNLILEIITLYIRCIEPIEDEACVYFLKTVEKASKFVWLFATAKTI